MGLLPGQVGRGWIVVAFAVTGLLDAVATWATASGSGWALPVIVVLNALQSLASLGALLSENGTIRSRSGDAQDYAAYANFVAAYQQYVTQYQQGSMPYYAAARAGAVAEAAAEMSAADTGDAAQESEALRARYAQYDAYTTAENNAGNSAGGPTSFVPRDPGLPGAIRGGPRGQRQRVERERSGETSST